MVATAKFIVGVAFLPLAANYFAPAGRPAVAARPHIALRTPVINAMEADEAYRMLGLGEDSTYDEIEVAFQELSAKYGDDIKRKIRLQVAKDEILDDRLRQSMKDLTAGKLKGKAPINPRELQLDKGPQPRFKIPAFAEGFMELPTKQYLLKNAGVFGVIGLLPLLSASFASTSISLGFAIALYLLYNRGVEVSESGAEYRQFKAKPLIKTAGITFLAGAIGGTLSQVIYGAVRAFFAQELVISLCTSFGFFTAATLFKAQDEY